MLHHQRRMRIVRLPLREGERPPAGRIPSGTGQVAAVLAALVVVRSVGQALRGEESRFASEGMGERAGMLHGVPPHARCASLGGSDDDGVGVAEELLRRTVDVGFLRPLVAIPSPPSTIDAPLFLVYDTFPIRGHAMKRMQRRGGRGDLQC